MEKNGLLIFGSEKENINIINKMEYYYSNLYNNSEEPIIIIGSGIAGLYCAYHLSKTGKNVIVFEKYDQLGGRMLSIDIQPKKKEKYLIEGGAGVIRSDDIEMIDLAKELDVEMNFWDSKTDIIYHDSKTNKNKLLDLDYKRIIQKVCKNSDDSKSFLEVVENSNLSQEQITGLLIGTSYSELYEANSRQVCEDNDLEEFMNISKYKYGKPAKGWRYLIDALKNEILANKGQIYTNTPVLKIDDTSVIVDLDSEPTKFKFSKLFVTAPVHFIKEIELTPSLNEWYDTINNLISETNYLRVYSYFESPLKIDNKIVTNLSIRRIIPIRDNLIMTVYTDGHDADMIYNMSKSKDKKKLSRYIMKELKKLLGFKKMPKIKENYPIYWKNGISSWNPSFEELDSIIPFIQNPIPNVYFCGDTYSINPGWVTGALSSANEVLNLINNN